MILIVGGAFQGKEKVARCLAKKAAEDGPERPVICNLHEILKKFCSADKDEAEIRKEVDAYLSRLLSECPTAVITCNELGCGIVPCDRTDRFWREITGEACQRLAWEAEEVYRVMCGLVQPLKTQKGGGRP